MRISSTLQFVDNLTRCFPLTKTHMFAACAIRWPMLAIPPLAGTFRKNCRNSWSTSSSKRGQHTFPLVVRKRFSSRWVHGKTFCGLLKLDMFLQLRTDVSVTNLIYEIGMYTDILGSALIGRVAVRRRNPLYSDVEQSVP